MALRVAIAGGHGQIALHLTRALAARGDEIVSLIRNPDHEGDVRAAGGEPVVCDLETADAQTIAEAIGRADVIVFAAGAGPGSGAERKESMDFEGAAKLIAAAGSIHPERFVMISAMSADSGHRGDEVFDVYLRAKGRADDELQASGIPYTIVRPGRLTDQPASGTVSAGLDVGYGEISREDVAAAIVACIDSDAAEDEVVDLISGPTPVDQIFT